MVAGFVALLVVPLQVIAGSGSLRRPAVDSARLERALRATQVDFERFRRARLPVREHYGGACDIHVGRYCYWRGDEADDDSAPPEPRDIVRRRAELIAALDSATAALPGDAWLAGQLARYLVEAGRADGARRVAETRCAAGAPWCLALAGYAAHEGGHYRTADSLYTAALAAMTDAQRCRWLDIGPLLEGALADRYGHLDCVGRAAMARRLLWLASPLLSVSTTDALTEHLARVTRARIAEHAETLDGSPWGDDERELMIRYGWPHWYSRTQPMAGSMADPVITGHDAGVPYDYLPAARLLDSLTAMSDDDWRLDDRLAPAGYAAAYIRTLHTVPHQLARFRRGDSILVVAAWDARRDTTLLGRALEASLVLASSDSVRDIATRPDQRATGTLSIQAPLDSGFVSLELRSTEDRRAARARLGVPPARGDRVQLSDLLLFAATGAPPSDLAAIEPASLGTMEIARGRPLGVYWELSGAPPAGAPVRFTLRVEQVGRGWLARAAERLHLAGPSSGLSTEWSEAARPTASGVAPRAVSVDLSRLRAGRYTVSLRASFDGQVVTTQRTIELR